MTKEKKKAEKEAEETAGKEADKVKEDLDKLNQKVESEIKKDIKEHSEELPCDENEHIRELTELLQRVHADFINYKKRVENDSAASARCATEDMIAKLLPILDNFELAFQHKDNHEEFAKGIEIIYSQLIETLKKEGLDEIKALGQKFNPNEHEALMAEASGKEEGIIIEEYQKGYKLGNKVLRMSKVKVSKKN